MGRMRRKKRVDAKQIGTELLGRGPDVVVIKLGARGAVAGEAGRNGVVEAGGFPAGGRNAEPGPWSGRARWAPRG